MKINYTFAKDVKELEAIQDKAIKAANNARTVIQVALVATVHHLAEHHDIRVARRLVDGLHETVRGKALVEYLCKYGHLTVGKVKMENDAGKEIEVTTFDGIKGSAEEHTAAIKASFDEAKATLWWTFKAPNPYKGFNLEQALQSVIAQNKKAMAKVANGEVDKDSVKTAVNDSTIKAVLSLCNFEAIIGEPLPVDARQAA